MEVVEAVKEVAALSREILGLAVALGSSILVNHDLRKQLRLKVAVMETKMHHAIQLCQLLSGDLTVDAMCRVRVSQDIMTVKVLLEQIEQHEPLQKLLNKPEGFGKKVKHFLETAGRNIMQALGNCPNSKAQSFRALFTEVSDKMTRVEDNISRSEASRLTNMGQGIVQAAITQVQQDTIDANLSVAGMLPSSVAIYVDGLAVVEASVSMLALE